jgi:hypothetical protein
MPGDYEIYRRLPGIVLGFHGCDESVGEALLCGKTKHLRASSNEYDWLGSGIYFWENDPKRAFEFAQEAVNNPHLTTGKISTPFVVGAVIDLGLCLNLLDRMALDEIVRAYDLLAKAHELAEIKLPENKGQDRGARYLDRAVLELLHESRTRMNSRRKTKGKFAPYDTVRGAFWEGGELYPNAGIGKKSHIQIAVRNPKCIKGYFRTIDS